MHRQTKKRWWHDVKARFDLSFWCTAYNVGLLMLLVVYMALSGMGLLAMETMHRLRESFGGSEFDERSKQTG